MYDAKRKLTKGTPVLYTNRYFDQENFDIVISGGHYGNKKENIVPSMYKIEYPSFTAVKTLVANSKYK